MNRMKTEFLYHYNRKNGLSLRERLFAYMPRYAPLVAKFGGLVNLRDVIPGLSQLSEKLLGLTSKRELPQWDSQPFCPEETSQKTTGPEVVLFADSFNTYFEPQVLRDGLTVLEAAGRRVIVPRAKNTRHKLCCGRTFLSSGLIDAAKLKQPDCWKICLPTLSAECPSSGWSRHVCSRSRTNSRPCFRDHKPKNSPIMFNCWKNT